MIPGNDNVIRITAEEANSSHVDDLLKRQMSLRGEPGVTRDRGRRWYYQNWLILMCAGSLGALVAWAILEPHFDDLLYFQGTVTAVDPLDTLPRRLVDGNQTFELRVATQGSLVINGVRIHLVEWVTERHPDGGQHRLNPASIKVGETLGVYVEYLEGWEHDLALGSFVVRSPPPQTPGREALSLSQLSARSQAAGFLLFAVVAGLVGLFVGAGDGLVCRLPRRALAAGLIGMVVGLVGSSVACWADYCSTPST